MSYNKAFYQKIILDHNRTPKNFGPLEGATHRCPGHNPLCGDQWIVSLICMDDLIVDIRFEGSGCAISKASASLMTQAVKGQSVPLAKKLFEQFETMLTGTQTSPELGELLVLESIRSTSSRVKCATLAWKAMLGALNGEHNISTEKS